MSRSKVKVGFNPNQIKDGHIVKLRKDGTIKSVGDKWEPKPKKKKTK